MIELEDVWFAHHDRDPCLRGMDLSVGTSDAVVVEGASGSGKSTLLRIATGLVPRVQGGRTHGRVLLDGRDVTELPAHQLPQRIGYVPQDPETAFVARTVQAEITSLLANVGVDGREARLRTEEALAEFEAHHLAHRDTATLSGGEAARVALAAAVAPRPDHLVLDEPAAQLDRDAAERLGSTLRALRACGMAVLVGAHPPHPHGRYATRTLRLGPDPTPEPPVQLPDPRDGPPVLCLEGAVHRYDNDAGVGPLELDVAPGEVVAVTGPNGSGKSTLVHLAAGLIEPQDGRVRVDGDDPRTLPAHHLAGRVGVSFQHPAWHITQDTVRDEVALTGRSIGHPLDVDAALRDAGLDAYAGAHPWDLSGGQRQRLAVATASAHEPDLVLLDEPTRGLDAASLNRFARLLARRARLGLATVVASHHPLVAGLAHRVVRLDEGLVADRCDHPLEVRP